ncbi:Site-specific recombinase XerD [Porphyromonas macacae]|uniref:Site-specific recombinase XerD n=1 Tax=Porphyromonas macacae TaxID=28115 RepID=A0A379E799_9PORP|nr:Site-specific recombinase XerD [Porphyromonas macacae]
MRSTFKILFYINKNKTKTDGTTAILCRITIDGMNVVITTGEKSKDDYKIFPDTVSKSKLSTYLKTIGLARGIRIPLGYHVGRHSFGTLTLEAGIPIESIAKMMGHTPPSPARKSTPKSLTKRLQGIWRD